MSVIYCPECGKKHEYNFAKPNFCSGCGNAFGMAKLKKSDKKTKKEEEYDDDDDDDEEFEDDDESFSNTNHVPNIRKIEVDIQTAAQYNTFDLGSIIDPESRSKPQAPAPRRKNRSISLEDFKQNKK